MLARGWGVDGFLEIRRSAAEDEGPRMCAYDQHEECKDHQSEAPPLISHPAHWSHDAEEGEGGQYEERRVRDEL